MRGSWERRLLYTALVIHVLAGVASVIDNWAHWDGPRRFTAPYERLLGVKQSWNMFAPNPPSSSRGLEVAVFREGGDWEVISPSYVPAREGRTIWHRRIGKVERNLLSESSEKRRGIIARHLCRHGYADAPVFGVRMVRVFRDTPEPGASVLPDWERELLTEEWCRR